MNVADLPPVAEEPRLSARQALRADGRWEGHARVGGMNCGACAVELELEARKISGLDAFEVNPASGLVSWVAQEPLAIDAMVQRAARLGYALDVMGQSDQNLQAQRVKLSKRNVFLRFLVAMLGMMQIMMYSAPEYLFSAEQIGEQEVYLLRWAQWVIALPLVFYCAKPFLSRALKATLQLRLVMDQPIALGIVLAFVVSSLSLPDLSAHVWFDSLAMLLSFLLMAQWLIERQTAKALEHLATLQPDLPLSVAVYQDGRWQDKPVVQLQAGVRFRLSPGQALPVDSTVSSTNPRVWVDEAMRTGEQAPMARRAGELVLAGSKLLGEGAEFEVHATGADGSFGKLGDLLTRAMAAKPVRQLVVDKVLPYFVAVVLLSAVFAGLWWSMVQGDPDTGLAVVLAVLIVTCPCALALALPLVRLFAIQQLVKAGVLVRNPQALDLLSKATVLALDKTGTLTHTGEQAHVQAHVLRTHALWSQSQMQALALCLARQSAHPLSRAISSHLEQNASNFVPVQIGAVVETPGRGLQTTVQIDGQSFTVRLGSASFARWVAMAHSQESATLVYLSMFAGEGFDPNVCDPSTEPLACVQFGIALPDDPALGAHLLRLSHRVDVHLLSGDSGVSVVRWKPELAFASRLASQTPHDKTAWIRTQQESGQLVVMMGDGLNDLGAFAQADVAVAAASSATLSASQADFLALRPGLLPLVSAFDIALRARLIGQQNLIWAMAYNGVAIPLAVSGSLTPWMAALGMGVSSLLVLANALRLKGLKP